jgi:hypothetical protein
MDFKSIDLRMWWLGLVTFGTAICIGALAVKERDFALIGLGVGVFGIGEWVQHPLQSYIEQGRFMVPTMLATAYPRRPKVFGIILNCVGLALILIGLYRFLTA